MRVLVLTEAFYPVRGGAQLVISELCKRSPTAEVVLYTTPLPGQAEYDERQTWRIIRSPALRPVTTMWPELSPDVRAAIAREDAWSRRFASLRLVRWLAYIRIIIDMICTARKERAEVILCGHPFLGCIAARMYCGMTGIAYVAYTYGEELTMLSRRHITRWLLQWGLRGARAVFTISRFSCQALESLGVEPRRVRLQLPAVRQFFLDAPQFRADKTRLGLGIEAETGVLLTVARLSERKGIDTVIRTLPGILRKGLDVLYMIVGCGSDESRLRALAVHEGVEEFVRFVGEVTDEELLEYYRACDVFVMPNRTLETTGETEGFGIVFLEANACGKPVIGGRAGGTVDAIEDGVSGLLVDPLNIDEVAEAIVRLLIDKEYARQLGENGRRRVVERFSWDRNAAEVWKELELAAAGVSQKRTPKQECL